MDLYNSIKLTNGWYWNSDVLRVMFQFMGADINDFRLEKPATATSDGLRRLSDSNAIKWALSQVKNEYTVVTGEQIRRENPDMDAISRSIKNYEMPYYLNYENPVLEYFQSFWQSDIGSIGGRRLHINEMKPIRTLFMLDVEYYNKHEPGNIIVFQKERFYDMEPSYQIIKHKLNEFGINHLAIMTGKGYHFISQIPYDDAIMDRMVEIGGSIEPSLYARQSVPHLRRDRPVPPRSELLFKAAVRLQQYLFSLVINEARRYSNIRIEISDRWDEGIAFDNTSATRHIDMSCFGMLGSVYLKSFLSWRKIGRRIVQNTPLPIRILRSKNNQEILSLDSAIAVRNNYDWALAHLSEIDGHIPDGRRGIWNLIKSYQSSGLCQFHKAMDSVEHDDPSIWWRTYRNYDGICASFPQVADLIRNPNPYLLQPDNLNYFINELFEQWGGERELWRAKHIGGLLRAIYEDGQFGWGDYFYRYDAARHANGWVELVLGQRFEKR